MENTVALAFFRAKVLGRATEAILAAAGVQWALLARIFGILATLCFGIAVGSTPRTAVRVA